VRDEWLDRAKGVTKAGDKITSITTLSGKTYVGKMFIDATYEGDLMALAGVDFHVGREANSVYGEQWNGVQVGVFQHGHYFKKPIKRLKEPSIHSVLRLRTCIGMSSYHIKPDNMTIRVCCVLLLILFA
jgi:hypothetical protein